MRGGVLVLGILLVTTVGPVLAGPEQDILDLIKEAGGGPLPKAKLDVIKKKYELEEVMKVYKPRDKGGLGIGPKGKADGIEIKSISLGKTPLPEAQLKKEAADLIRMGQVHAAVAGITQLYPVPKATKPGKGAKDWKDYAEQMKKSSFDLAKAVKAGNAKDVQKAANNMNNACNSCHSDFRD